MATGSLEFVLKRDRIIVGGALTAIVLLSWIYILLGAGTGTLASHMSGLPTAARSSDSMTTHMSGPMSAMQPVAWTAAYAALIFVMWWLMMMATMLPSAAPMILLFAALTRKRDESGAPYSEAGLFGSGYLVIWGAFSILAVALQWQLDRVALLSPMMVTTSIALGALLLIGAGVWQFTPLKHVCLRRCRAPAEFLTRHWSSGKSGAFQMGIRHGLYCLGCCWMMMLLLFFGGIMNIFWIAGLTTLVLVEKIAPLGPLVSGLVGVAFIVWGGVLIANLV